MARHKRLGFFKREDWRLLRSENIVFRGDAITLERQQYARGSFLLRAVDSGEAGFVWRRVSLEARLPDDSLIRVFARAADTAQYGDFGALEPYLEALPAAEYSALFPELFTLVGESEDFHLPLEGRYLWLAFELFGAGEEAPELRGLHLELSGDHMVDYLPEIYRKEGDFTRRFLSVFDSVLMDMEEKIYDLPGRFDYAHSSGEMLPYLADWVCVDAAGLAREETVARIESAFTDYETMFTPQGIRRSVERLTGRRPILIESIDVDPNAVGCVDSDLYRRLYGDNPYRFFVLLEEDTFRDRAEMEAFRSDMRALIPAHTELELVLLGRCVQLDKHSYLGLNSVVSDYVPVVLNENMTIHYGTTIGGKNSERD